MWFISIKLVFAFDFNLIIYKIVTSFQNACSILIQLIFSQSLGALNYERSTLCCLGNIKNFKGKNYPHKIIISANDVSCSLNFHFDIQRAKL